MTQTIWKEVLKPERIQTLMLPKDAYLLDAREQYDLPCIWFECNDQEPEREPRVIAMVGTGEPIPPHTLQHLGMTHHFGGTMVFHIYELEQESIIDANELHQSNTSA